MGHLIPPLEIICEICGTITPIFRMQRDFLLDWFPICLDCHLEIMDIVNDAEALQHE